MNFSIPVVISRDSNIAGVCTQHPILQFKELEPDAVRREVYRVSLQRKNKRTTFSPHVEGQTDSVAASTETSLAPDETQSAKRDTSATPNSEVK